MCAAAIASERASGESTARAALSRVNNGIKLQNLVSTEGGKVQSIPTVPPNVALAALKGKHVRLLAQNAQRKGRSILVERTVNQLEDERRISMVLILPKIRRVSEKRPQEFSE